MSDQKNSSREKKFNSNGHIFENFNCNGYFVLELALAKRFKVLNVPTGKKTHKIFIVTISLNQDTVVLGKNVRRSFGRAQDRTPLSTRKNWPSH